MGYEPKGKTEPNTSRAHRCIHSDKEHICYCPIASDHHLASWLLMHGV